MNGGWIEGVISGSNEIRSGIQYFVSTRHGIAAMFPRAHQRIRELEIGSYVRVITAPSRAAHSKNDEVQCVEWNKRPDDHEVEVKWKRIVVKCNANIVGEESGWFIFNNGYLGRLGMKVTGALNEKNMRIGCIYRVIVRRSKADDGLSSLRNPVVWVIEDVDYADRTLHTDQWFEGVVTRSDESLVMITAPDLPVDVLLYDWKEGSSIMPDQILGRWVRFQVERRRSSDHGLRYRAMNNFIEIKSLFKTRVKFGITELLIRCTWNGEMEDSKALLHSKIGPIRDNGGILDTNSETTNNKGEYEFWVVKHFRQNHTARWKLSIYDNDSAKICGRISTEERRDIVDDVPVDAQDSSLQISQRPKKDGRILEMMVRLMKINSVQGAIVNADRETAMKIKNILDRYVVRRNGS